MPHQTIRSVQSPFWRRVFTPSLADLFFPVLLLAAFGRPDSWLALLADGDTGWHIRTGDFILKTHTVPVRDLFSFSRPDQPWFAWEWLSDVLFSILHHWRGLEGVVGFAAVVLCLSAVVLLRLLLRAGTGLWVALPVTLAVISASSIHYLARPHIFSLLLATVTVWLLDDDRRSPGWRVCLVVAVVGLWANLHGGFVAGLAILGLRTAASAFERQWKSVRRYGFVTLFSAAATLINPYGWGLHQHIFAYLRSSWIMDNVQEFQSPRIRAENMEVFAVLLLVGVALVSRAFARRDWFDGTLVLTWAFAALRSARHVPLYALAAAPVIATEFAQWWGDAALRSSKRSPVRILWELSQEFGRSRSMSAWTPLLAAVALWIALPHNGLRDFPQDHFPNALVARNAGLVHGAVLTSDQWADYLIFHFYPAQRVFFDGRSDFYGPELGNEYQELLAAGRRWREVMDRYHFNVALLPSDWPLGSLLESDPAWLVVDREAGSLLLARRDSALKPDPDIADVISVGEVHEVNGR